MEEINVEKIMEEIRAGIPVQEDGWAALRFEDIPVENGSEEALGEGSFDQREFEKCVSAASGGWQVNFFRPIPGGRVKGFFKRVVRKLIRFCLEPICIEVTAFNKAVLHSLQSLRRFVKETLAQNKRRDAELALLRREVAELRERLDALEKRDA